jgi:squalene-hopene/tetraprenyl-beta-curcumene cyclase
MTTSTTQPTSGSSAPTHHAASAGEALERAVAHLRGLQSSVGFWKGELETNVTMDAEDLLLREFLGIRRDQETAEAARWIRSQQRADGTWATFHGGPADLSTTVEAWVALRLAGDDPNSPWMLAASGYVRAEGGVARTRVFTRIWLALFGLWSWDELPVMPPELILLPRWAPLNIYNWACWARQTVVPLTVVAAARPVRPLSFDITELQAAAPRPERARIGSWAWVFGHLDNGLKVYARRPVARIRARATERALAWVLARQEADGSWGGIQPPWVYSLLALHLSGYSLDHPAMRAGITGLEGFILREQTPDGVVRRVEACQSPVWDTALALIALLDAGVAPDDRDMLRAGNWLLGEEINVRGDWAVRRRTLAPGGWAFEFANDGYPDTDDTAEIVLALRRLRPDDASLVRSAVERGVCWLLGMQSRDGGWGAFDADNTHPLATRLPFCDFGAVLDPPSADVTAHIVEALAVEGLADSDSCRRGVGWLLDHQEPDGSWFGRWGANYVYGIGAVVPALVKAGVPASGPPVTNAVRWLEDHQNDDGGWGEDLRSYRDRDYAGRGESTASQTAWALLALHAAGQPVDRSTAAGRGVEWLVRNQRADGSWNEPQFTGTGFPGDFYINYHLYRAVFPISALGRCLEASA